MTRLPVALFCLFVFTSNAQWLQDHEGKVYLEKKPITAGTRMLFPEFQKADVITFSGKVFKNMLVNLNLETNDPVFLQKDTVILAFAEEVLEMKIRQGDREIIIKKGNSIDLKLPSAYIVLLNRDPALMKYVRVKVDEVNNYGQTERTYQHTVDYYIKASTGYKKIRLTKAEAQNVFADKWQALQAFATENRLSFKKEEEWVQMMKYYGSLR